MADSKLPNLDGLGKQIADDCVCRKILLQHNTLFVWPSKETIGIVNMDSLALNVRLLRMVCAKWCPQTPSGKTLCIDQAREEAGS